MAKIVFESLLIYQEEAILTFFVTAVSICRQILAEWAERPKLNLRSFSTPTAAAAADGIYIYFENIYLKYINVGVSKNRGYNRGNTLY